VFSINDGEDEDNGKSAESEVVHGKRFTPEENATLMEAIMSYIEMKQLGENGLEMIRACSKHPELKGCWAEIGKMRTSSISNSSLLFPLCLLVFVFP
jgi:hypothetical protein